MSILNSLRGLDLNLLVTLDALLAEHSVTRAAERLHLSQPSVSVHLSKLRAAFDDPLLLPGPRGMRPTARAEALREPLRQALSALAGAVASPQEFDPAKSDATWRVMASDYGASAILLPALPRLRAAAPGSRLAVLDLVPARIARMAEQGDIDLAFHIRSGAPSGMRHRTVFTERYVLVGRAGHPRLVRRPTLAQFCKLEHVVVSPDGGGFEGPADVALRELGLTRRVVLSVPHFLFMRNTLARTDLVALVPERLLSDTKGLRVVDPPLEVPGFEMLMLWHERVHRDLAQQWLRDTLIASL